MWIFNGVEWGLILAFGVFVGAAAALADLIGPRPKWGMPTQESRIVIWTDRLARKLSR